MRAPKAGAAQPKLAEHPHPKELRYAETTLEPLALALKTNLWPRLSQRGAFIILVRTPGVLALGEPARELTVLDTLPVHHIPATLKKSHS
jgi:hypothetical protein